jgi:nucleotidyltransferase substrate binding protein (TIGR01987 family)
MQNTDVRWQQRLAQFEKAFYLLETAIALEKLSVIERAGLIQFFEMAFELGWKLLKDYQEAEGYVIKSPREAIKQAFQGGLVRDGHVWMEALGDRNLTTHTYNEQTAAAVEQKIRTAYYPALAALRQAFTLIQREFRA